MRLYRAIADFPLGPRLVLKGETLWLWPHDAQYLHVVPADARPARRKGGRA